MAQLKFECKRCGKEKYLKDMWILRQPNGKPEKLCCRACFDEHISKI